MRKDRLTSAISYTLAGCAISGVLPVVLDARALGNPRAIGIVAMLLVSTALLLLSGARADKARDEADHVADDSFTADEIDDARERALQFRARIAPILGSAALLLVVAFGAYVGATLTGEDEELSTAGVPCNGTAPNSELPLDAEAADPLATRVTNARPPRDASAFTHRA